MGEWDPAERPGQADLAGVQMAGEHQLERVRRQRLGDFRVVTEEQPKRRLPVDELPRAGSPVLVGLRVDTDHAESLAAELADLRTVAQEHGLLEVTQLRRP